MTRFAALTFPGFFFLSWSFLGLGQDPGLITPAPREGWKITVSPEVEMTEAALAEAPTLAPWPEHGPRKHFEAGASFEAADAAGKAEWMKILTEAVRIANAHLPKPFLGDFNLWVFGDVPYAAKAAWPDLVLSSRILSPGQRKRLPWVVAHEIHHLALMQSGWLTPQAAAPANILAGLLSEGVATWMCWSSGLFPELDRIFEDPEALSLSFSQLREALEGAGENRPSTPDLYHQNKWGYYAGSWMIQEIDRNFGKRSWMELLSQPSHKATMGLIELYRRTQPVPEYSF